jgi:hypothetical protein
MNGSSSAKKLTGFPDGSNGYLFMTIIHEKPHTAKTALHFNAREEFLIFVVKGSI